MPQSHGNTAARTPIHAPVSRSYQGPFGRMFRNCRPWEPAGVERSRRRWPIMERLATGDGRDEPCDPTRDNETIPAGYTYFGQFVDHDITFDPRSQPAEGSTDPENWRTSAPRPSISTASTAAARTTSLHVRRHGQFLIGNNGQGDEDLVRNTNGERDHRRQAQRREHHRLAAPARLPQIPQRGDGAGRHDFDEAQRLVRWHYQWVVVHDWLKRCAATKVVDDILCGSGCPGQAEALLTTITTSTRSCRSSSRSLLTGSGIR